MATDIAEFLKKNFLERVQEKELLSLSPAITSLLNDIKKEFTENNKTYWSPPPYSSLSCFYQLDYALAECQAYKHQTKTCLERTFSKFSSDLEPDLKNMLSKIKEDLTQIRMKDNKNANSSSSIFTSTDSPTRKGSSYFSGFGKEIPEKILKWLESDYGFKAIGIHGMCGTGKTTLVKEILNNERVRGKYAEPIWVCLSDTTSEEIDIRIVNEILLCLNDDPDLLTEEPEDDFLVKRLREKLKGQKYLIVLDGVWHCNDWFSNLWVDEKGDRTKLPFSMALPKDTGGAVIVTSRVKEVTKQLVKKKKEVTKQLIKKKKEVTKQLVGEKNLIHIQPWDDENMKGFVRKCLERSGEEIPNDKMIDEVVYHCQGLPLVAETLSGWIAEQIAKNSSPN